jgi:predicted ATPase
LQHSQEAVRLAQELDHPFSLAFAWIYAAGVRQFRREGQAAQHDAEAAVALATTQGFSFLSARGRSVQGWGLTEEGHVAEGITQMRQSLTVYHTLGIERGRPHFLAVLAEASSKAGQIEEGLTLVAGAQEALTTSGERWYEAELWRLKGELTLQQGKVASRKSKSRF